MSTFVEKRRQYRPTIAEWNAVVAHVERLYSLLREAEAVLARARDDAPPEGTEG